MAGIQQAVNALTGSFGTVAGRVGIYNELVGKNQELIEELGNKNTELENKNKELENKNKKIQAAHKMSMEQAKITGNLAERIYANARAKASRDIMLDVVYGEMPTAGPTRDYVKEEVLNERKEGGK